MFPCVRPRPVSLSNRGCCTSDEQLAAILRKPETALGWSDFSELFPIAGCAGAYDEQLWFVPFAFEHLAGHPDDGREYVSGFVEFFARNAGALERDRLTAATERSFEELLAGWTTSFEVVHFDAAACEKKGWSLLHNDYAVRSVAVTELVELLVRRPFLEDIAERAVQRLLDAHAPDTAAAWFLEIARALQQGELTLADGSASTRLQDLLTDPEILLAQLERVRALVAAERSPTYWPDALAVLGLG